MYLLLFMAEEPSTKAALDPKVVWLKDDIMAPVTAMRRGVSNAKNPSNLQKDIHPCLSKLISPCTTKIST